MDLKHITLDRILIFVIFCSPLIHVVIEWPLTTTYVNLFFFLSNLGWHKIKMNFCTKTWNLIYLKVNSFCFFLTRKKKGVFYIVKKCVLAKNVCSKFVGGKNVLGLFLFKLCILTLSKWVHHCWWNLLYSGSMHKIVIVLS